MARGFFIAFKLCLIFSPIFAPEMKFSHTLFFILIETAFLILALPDLAEAQCAMCKAVAESNQNAKGEQHFGANLNSAILYLMAVPYLVLTFLAFLFFKKEIMTKVTSLRARFLEVKQSAN